MNTQQKIAAKRESLGSIHPDLLVYFTNTQAIRRLSDEFTPQLIRQVKDNVGLGPYLNVGNAMSAMKPLIEHAALACNALTLLPVLESQPIYKEACEAIQPLLDEIEALEEKLAEELQELGFAERELEAAREKATAEALAAVDKDAKVAKALATVKRLGQPLEMATN